MRRREFIAGLVSAAAMPFAARAQHTPVIGFLGSLSRAQSERQLEVFRRGLGEVGFAEGSNVALEYRFAEGQYGRLPGLAAELIGRPVDLLVTQAPPAALAAKAATTTVPIVFSVGIDPVAAGLVSSFNRPGGNATGILLNPGPIAQKRLEIVRELVPKAVEVALLVNPGSPEADLETRDVEVATQANKLQLRQLKASTRADFDVVFASLAQRRTDALLIGSDPFFYERRQEIVGQVARIGIPAIYPFREFAEVGGLVSYGINLVSTYRVVGVYAGRILKGAKPAELPVVQPTTLELVINLAVAKALGVSRPARTRSSNKAAGICCELGRGGCMAACRAYAAGLELPLSLQMRIDEVIE